MQNDPVNFVDPSGLNLQAPTAPPECTEFDRTGACIVRGSMPDPFLLTGGAAVLALWNPIPYIGGGPGSLDTGGGGGNGVPQHPLVPEKRLMKPCEGLKGSDLKYDVPRKKPDPDGAKTAREHITNRHINQLPKHAGNKSVYEFGNLNSASAETKMAIVSSLNAATFNAGLALPQVQGDGSLRYLFVLDFNIFSPAMPRPYTGGQAIVGKVYTKTIKGKRTGTNSLVVEGDCQTVVTSFPS